MRRFFQMLSTLLKLAIFLAIATWLYMHPGSVHIEWQGQTIETSTGFASVVALVVLFAFGILYHGWRSLLNIPRDWRRHRRMKSLELGYAALNKGLLGVAAADSITATKNAKKALSALPDLALSHLLAAQAAQLRHDEVTADTHLAKLAQHPEGQLFGLRGQLTRALQRNDSTEAVRLSRLAYQQQPQQPWVVDTAVQMEARAHNWLQAEKILRQAIRLGTPEAEKWQRDLAAVMVTLCDEFIRKNDIEAALECARDALKQNPGWTPAVLRVANLWHRKAYRRRAQKALLKAWETNPHPQLVASWLEVTGGERATDRTAIIEKLVAENPDNAEAAFAMAMAYYNSGLWGVARQHAQRAIDYRPDRAAYRLMADIEQADSGNAKRVRAWLDMAADAPVEPVWQCLVTGEVHDKWLVLNRNSDFNTIQWQSPFAHGGLVRMDIEPANLTQGVSMALQNPAVVTLN